MSEAKREEGWSRKLPMDEYLRLPCGICGQQRSRHVGQVLGCFRGYGTYWHPEGEPDPRLIKPSPDERQPAQEPDRITLLEKENAALRAALDAYRMLFTKSELEERVRIFNAYRPLATAAPAATAAPSEGAK